SAGGLHHPFPLRPAARAGRAGGGEGEAEAAGGGEHRGRRHRRPARGTHHHRGHGVRQGGGSPWTEHVHLPDGALPQPPHLVHPPGIHVPHGTGEGQHRTGTPGGTAAHTHRSGRARGAGRHPFRGQRHQGDAAERIVA